MTVRDSKGEVVRMAKFDAKGRFLSYRSWPVYNPRESTQSFEYDDHDRLIKVTTNSPVTYHLEGDGDRQCTFTIAAPDGAGGTRRKRCWVEKGRIRSEEGGKREEYELVADGWLNPKDGEHAVRFDAKRRVVALDDRKFERTEDKVLETYYEYGVTGDDRTEAVDTWTLGADALPVAFVANHSTFSVEWTRVVVVRVVDGTCARGCNGAGVERVAAAVAANPTFEVERGDPAKEPRAASEVWYQAGKRALAEGLVRDGLAGVVRAENIREWKWGGGFDLLVVVGPDDVRAGDGGVAAGR